MTDFTNKLPILVSLLISLPKSKNLNRFDMHNDKNNSMSKSLEYFFAGIKSPATKKNYLSALKQFRKYYEIKDFDSLLTYEPDELRKMLEQYVIHEKNKGLSAKGINVKIAAIKLFFSMNDIFIITQKAIKMLPAEKKHGGGKPYPTKQLQEILKCLNTRFSLPLKSAVLIIASCGSRVGFAQYLKVKDIGEFEKNGCKSILIYSGEIEEYYSFINPETVKVIDEWIEYRKSKGELITKDSWVIPKANDHTKAIEEGSISARIHVIIRNVDRGEMIGSRHEISITHGIRKRWNTVAKDTDGVNSNKVEKMFGHHSRTIENDTTYYKPDLAKLFKEYEKFSDRLTVSEESILEIELRNKDKIIESTHAEKDDRIKELINRITLLEKFVKV